MEKKPAKTLLMSLKDNRNSDINVLSVNKTLKLPYTDTVQEYSKLYQSDCTKRRGFSTCSSHASGSVSLQWGMRWWIYDDSRRYKVIYT